MLVHSFFIQWILERKSVVRFHTENEKTRNDFYFTPNRATCCHRLHVLGRRLFAVSHRRSESLPEVSKTISEHNQVRSYNSRGTMLSFRDSFLCRPTRNVLFRFPPANNTSR